MLLLSFKDKLNAIQFNNLDADVSQLRELLLKKELDVLVILDVFKLHVNLIEISLLDALVDAIKEFLIKILVMVADSNADQTVDAVQIVNVDVNKVIHVDAIEISLLDVHADAISEFLIKILDLLVDVDADQTM
jgi:hypothetical protein